jgi:Fe-S-cluster containining protein
MVQPDAERCGICGGNCCCGSISLYPYDFEEGKEVNSVIELLKRELVELFSDGTFIQIRTSENTYDGNCVFKCVWGCIIPADMRPIICKFYGPTLEHPQKCCYFLQNFNVYRDKSNWDVYSEEFLKMGVLECPNVHTSGWYTK